MYKKPIIPVTTMSGIVSKEGESIETMIERHLTNNEPIDNTVGQLIYTDRADGVINEYNVRADRFDMAIEATDSVARNQYAKRKEALKEKAEKANPGKPAEGETPVQ